jgi:hypothetical protein
MKSPTSTTSTKNRVIACALLALALWSAAEPAAAQSIIEPVGEQFNSWIDTFEADLFPVTVTGGLLLAVALGVFMSIKIGIFAVVGVVACAVLWGTREAIIALGS